MKNGTIDSTHLEAILKILARGTANRPTISESLVAFDIKIPRTTLIRLLGQLIKSGEVSTTGKGRATTYSLPSFNPLLVAPQERDITQDYHFNRNIFDSFTNLLTPEECVITTSANTFTNLKELERYIIDLSWKSSTIEGNTYSHFDTLNLLTRGQKANNKTSAETQMILNHKTAIEYIFTNPVKKNHLTLDYILKIHGLLVDNLAIHNNIRTTRVGISGTTYQPPTPSELPPAIDRLLLSINQSPNPIEQSLIALSMISYLQIFQDGNKRTARLISNAILVGSNIIPPSYFNVPERDFLYATLLFYEQNTIVPLKIIFLDGLTYSKSHYFLHPTAL